MDKAKLKKGIKSRNKAIQDLINIRPQLEKIYNGYFAFLIDIEIQKLQKEIHENEEILKGVQNV